MADRIQIYNRTLTLLGLDEVSSSTEDNKRTKALNTAWDMIVPELMFSQPWLFTIKEATIAQLTQNGIVGYDNAFRYPADCLAVIEPTSDDVIIKIQGDVIYSNTESLTIQYIIDEKDLSKWSTGFAKCVSYLLGMTTAYRLIEDSKREGDLTEMYYAKVLPEAITTDAMQVKPEQIVNVMVAGGYED